MEVSYYIPDFNVLKENESVFDYIASFISFLVSSLEAAFSGFLDVLEVVANVFVTFKWTAPFFSSPAQTFISTMIGAIVSLLIWRMICAIFF